LAIGSAVVIHRPEAFVRNLPYGRAMSYPGRGWARAKVSPAMSLTQLSQTVAVLATVVPNPDPQAPPGVSAQMSAVLGYVKWGVLVVIIIAAFVGVGAIAGGRVFSHHGASKVGVSMLVSSVVAAILYVGIYSFVTSITG
jgi:hypothetical protein